MKKSNKILSLLLCAVLICVSLAGCAAKEQKDIVILFTNDVHCAVSEHIGYAGLAAYQCYVEEQTPHVTLVDLGDAVQGGVIGAVSRGEDIVEIMNAVGYDFAVLGNHEFDYGMDRLSQLIDMAEATYLSANLVYTGTGENLLADVKPYEIVRYGEIDVAYIGLTTPWSIASSTPTYFMDENGEYVYQFSADDTQSFYDCVQSYIDASLEDGAEYVILCTHLGDAEEMTPYSSVEVIQNTQGADAVLDAHAHSTIPCRIVEDKAGQQVLLSSTGTTLNAIGQLTISAAGTLSVGVISQYDAKDPEIQTLLDQMQTELDAEMGRTVANTDVSLPINDESGVRMVRNRETAIGNFCADAYRSATGAQIAVVNGGGIRAELPAGEVTYADMIAVNPFGNMLCMVEATGQEVLDTLEIAYCNVQSVATENGAAVGENGGFLHVSGLKVTIDTTQESTVTFDAMGTVTSLGETRRVREVLVEQEDGSYAPIDPTATYTFASHNYLIKNGGDGSNIMSDNELLINDGLSDYQVLIDYMLLLGGDLSAYHDIEGRIIIQD